ncbi:MAG: 2-phosphosulfolactate phosphatase [Methanocella sp.]
MRYFVGPEGRDEFLRDPAGVPVIVDVLRATSTIVMTLSCGAARVIPVRDYDEALAVGRRLNALTVGERNGIKVEGFVHGNSPTELSVIPLKGKTIVMVTTNGTQIMVEGGIIASTLNAGAVARAIAATPHAYLLASGSPRKSDEDLCAAGLIERIAGRICTGSSTGEAVASTVSSDEGRKLLDGIRRSRSGEKLTAYGYGADVELVCSAINRFPVLPVYHNGEIRLVQGA